MTIAAIAKHDPGEAIAKLEHWREEWRNLLSALPLAASLGGAEDED
ncbi:MAG TPA: hypothetical protein VER03_07440 [Bryobacteraceae bacterium]|nr:hypothetical protein [Bryobacteraceae bacterium]